MYHHERPREVSQQRSTARPNLWEGGRRAQEDSCERVGGFFFVHTRLRAI